MAVSTENWFGGVKCVVIFAVFGQALSIYNPNEIDQSPKPYTTGIKIKTSHYKTASEPYYHSNYSKVYVHNKNYTSSLLDSPSDVTKSSRYGQPTNVYPVYISEEKKEKMKNVLKEHNTNVVDKEMLNDRVVYKRKIEKSTSIEVYNKCPKGVTGQFVYDASCNQYLDCWSGRGGPRNCAPGTLFNPKTLECDFPEKVECLTGPSASSLVSQKSAKLQSYEQAKCPEGFSGLIPNYADCSKFIQCNSGIQTAGTCPPGTLFDVNLNVCNHPQETTCFSGQSGTNHAAAKEQYSAGSSDTTGHYQRQTGYDQGQTGQYPGSAGHYQGQYPSQSGYIMESGTSHLHQSQSRDGRQQSHATGGGYGQYGVGCDPTSPYCNTGGYVISGKNIYNSPQRGAASVGSPGQSQGQASGGTVYIQYVMCNPLVEDCTSFQQGTFLLGPGGTLCNPVKQNCSVSTHYIPSNKMHPSSQTIPSTVPTSGVYYVKYVMCNSLQEDCSKYQNGVMTATYGVPGTHAGIQPVPDGTGRTQTATKCNPQIHNCDTIRYHGQESQISSNNQPSSNQDRRGYTCNPQYQNCGPDFQGGGSQIGHQQKYNGSINFKRVCSAGDENCYQAGSAPPTQTYGTQKDRGGEPKCPEGFQGITKHPTSCEKFLNCANGITYVQDCAPGTLFNPFILTCDFPYNVDCKVDPQEHTTAEYPDIDDHQDQYEPVAVHPPLRQSHIPYCQGSQCTQGQGQYVGVNQNESVPAEGNRDSSYGQTRYCQGSRCYQGHSGQSQEVYQGQGQQQGQLGENLGQQPGQISCQGSRCYQGHSGQGQGVYQGQGQPQGQLGGNFGQQPGQTSCQGSRCYQGHSGQGQGVYQGQGQPQGQLGGNFGQQPGQTSCQGSRCYQGHSGQGQGVYQGQGQPQGQPGGNFGQTSCQGSQCEQAGQSGQDQRTNQGQWQPQGQLEGNYGQTSCQGSQCDQTGQSGQGQGIYQGQRQPQGQLGGNSGQTSCQGSRCYPAQVEGQHQGQSGNQQVQGGCQGSQCDNQANLYSTTTQRQYTWTPKVTRRPGEGSQGQGDGYRDNESNVMKIPPRNRPQGVTPLNKSDRATSGGFNNERSVDYVDIFDPDESRNFAFASTTRRSSQKPEKQVWPPPYPDLATTDPDADYVYEYEDGEPVTLAPEKVNIDKRKKSRCDDNDFVCDRRSCVAKNFVCDGVRDCDDGKDEKYCEKYLEEFKAYKNSRLDVLERQRWDNVSYSTCALLCMDSQKFQCISFNYRKGDRVCFLTSENIGSSGALKNYYPCDYYERKSTSMDCSGMYNCPNGKCLKSDEICDGYDDCGDRDDERGCRAEDFGYRVKLAGGQEANEGRVEVTVFGKTGYICDDQFGITDADVLCKELGFNLGAAEVKGNSFYAKDLKENHTLYMMDDIECIGNETSIMHCNFAGWGIHNCADKEIAGVICKTPEETCSEGFWKCDTGNECVKLPFLCDDLDDCTDNSDEASHHCDSPTELRLVNGSKPNEGRLEVRHHDIWGSVCDDDFNEDAAKIVCRHLGYSGSAYVRKDAYFGQSSGPIWLDQVSCYGNESSIEKCTHWEWGGHNCDHSEDVGVVCSNEVQAVDAQRSSKAFGGGISSAITNSATSGSPEPVSCGYRKENIFLQDDDVHFRVVQGSVAKPGDYPWQAALRINGQERTAHWCGAVVIADKWVLTAAHCLEGYPKGAYVVVAGEYNMDEDEGTEQQVFIEEYYIHENFRQGHKMGNDIAMVKLKGNGFRLNQDIQPICLPDESSDYERELNCTISGFGTVQTGKSAYSHKLRAAWIPIQKMDVCKMAHIYGDNIAEGMICAGDLTGGGDACDGDSGGPLACLEDGVFTLYGLTSWGQRCGYANKPGVYVKVSHYKKWINKIMMIHS